MSEETTCDVVVVGAGFGGMSAAARASELGLNVVLLEAGPKLGGTAMHSGGLIQIRGAKDFETYLKSSPLATPALLKKVFDGFHPYLNWLQALGAPGSYRYVTLRGVTHLGYVLGDGHEPHRRTAWFRYLEKYVKARKGSVLLNARVRSLLTDEGRVNGVVAETPRGNISVRARSVILAAGGYQNDKELLGEYFGAAANDFVQRAVEHDRGDGLRLARSAGGQITDTMDSIWGGLMPASPATINWRNYLEPALLCAYYAEGGIVVNVLGERFIEESNPDLPSISAVNKAMTQPPGGIWVILDDKARRAHALYEIPRQTLRPWNLRYAKLSKYFRVTRQKGRLVIGVDSLRLAQDRGAIVLKASTVPELCQKMAAHGVDAVRLEETITSFNDAIASGTGSSLEPRSNLTVPLLKAPFFAIKVAVGISMTHGGVVIDDRARVLNEAGQPIPGLFAIPGTAGGVHGSLSSCGVFGVIAANEAHETLVSR